MSRSARYTGVFGDGRHDFQLKIGQLEELQEKTDAGPEELLDRLMSGKWRVADLREPLRLGLIGAGTEPISALLLVDRYASPGNLITHKSLVINVLSAALIGAPDEDTTPEKPKRRRAKRSPAAKSASDPITK